MKVNLLKSKMKLYGDNYESLAKILGCTVATLSRKINGIYKFKEEEIKTICEHYEMTDEEIKELILG